MKQITSSSTSPLRRQRLLRWGVICGGLVLAWLGYCWFNRAVPTAPTEIFTGITYSCWELPPSEEGSGLVHLVMVDLTMPGIEPYITPLDGAAVAAGHQYQLTFPKTVAQQEHLAVLVNGTLHRSRFSWLPLPGDWADSLDSVISQGEISHIDANSYLLWFDAAGHATMETTKPPRTAALQQAKWGISGHVVAVSGQVLSQYLNHVADSRTAIGLDSLAGTLWLATFENASETVVAETLVHQGAQEVMLLDGGSSTAMVIGPGAQHGLAGVRQGGYRPVATCFGVRVNGNSMRDDFATLDAAPTAGEQPE